MLVATYKTGSSLLLKNPRDVDYVRFYDTKEECFRTALNHKREEGKCIHFDYVRPLEPFIYCYLWHFMELVEGEDLHLNEFNMFEEENKKQYKKILLQFAKILKDGDKKWYHILAVCYMFENNSYKLKAKQLAKVQQVHDEGIDEETKAFCLNQLN